MTDEGLWSHQNLPVQPNNSLLIDTMQTSTESRSNVSISITEEDHRDYRSVSSALIDPDHSPSIINQQPHRHQSSQPDLRETASQQCPSSNLVPPSDLGGALMSLLPDHQLSNTAIQLILQVFKLERVRYMDPSFGSNLIENCNQALDRLSERFSIDDHDLVVVPIHHHAQKHFTVAFLDLKLGKVTYYNSLHDPRYVKQVEVPLANFAEFLARRSNRAHLMPWIFTPEVNLSVLLPSQLLVNIALRTPLNSTILLTAEFTV